MNGLTRILSIIAAIFCVSANAFASELRHESEVSSLVQRASAGGGAADQAVDELLSNIAGYQAAANSSNKGAFEDNLKARLKAIDSIWALGQIGDPRVMRKLSEFYLQADDTLKMNLLISIGKLKNNKQKAGPFIFDVAADARETEVVRAMAFEVLDLIGYPSTVVNLQRSQRVGIEKADLIYTGGITGTISGWFSPDLPIGHAGLFVGTEARDGKIKVVIADCVPDNFKPGGVRNIDSWSNFTHHFMYPYYGHRSTPVRPTAAQRERIARLAVSMGKQGLTYSDTHFSQKGPLKFDCVGYTEFLYEAVGLNPTENSYETGTGWPLTPWEQFIAVTPTVQAAPAAIAAPSYNVVTPNQALITGSFSGLAGAFRTAGVELRETSGDIRPSAAE